MSDLIERASRLTVVDGPEERNGFQEAYSPWSPADLP